MRTTVSRHASKLGEWEFVQRAPHPLLRTQVIGYCGYDERTPEPRRRRELPSGHITLILSFGPQIEVLESPAREAPGQTLTSFVAGLDDTYALTAHAGLQHGVEVNLTPLGARMALGVPMRELARREVPLEDALGPAGKELNVRLADASDWPERFALLDRFLASRLLSARQPVPVIAHAWRRLEQAHGSLRMAALAREVGCSPRYLSEGFRDQIGLAPKAVARVLRFRRAVSLLQRSDGEGLARIAEGCGYSDQPHLNRDFQALAGCAPGEFLGRLLPGGAGVSGH